MRLGPVALLQHQPQIVGMSVEHETPISCSDTAQPHVTLDLIDNRVIFEDGEHHINEIGVFWRPEQVFSTHESRLIDGDVSLQLYALHHIKVVGQLIPTLAKTYTDLD